LTAETKTSFQKRRFKNVVSKTSFQKRRFENVVSKTSFQKRRYENDFRLTTLTAMMSSTSQKLLLAADQGDLRAILNFTPGP
jgi:hypothetical protein